MCDYRCAEKVEVKAGKDLYEMNREALKEMFGMSDGTRLFSHLQKDKARVSMSRRVHE